MDANSTSPQANPAAANTAAEGAVVADNSARSSALTQHSTAAQESATSKVAEAETAADKIVDAPIALGQDLPAVIDLLPEQVQPYWLMIQKIPLLEGLLILLLFCGMAYFIRRYVIALVMRLAGKTKGQVDDQIVEELQNPIFNTVVLLGVMLAVAVSSNENGWTRYITPILVSIIILIWIRTALALASIIITAISRDDSHFKKIDVRTEPLLIIASKILILLIGSYILLIIWGINPVGLLASAGIVGIAVGFAAKDTLANLFSGVFILADRPYKLGDYVNLDSGERGKVTHIGIRSTRILTRDDIEVTIPNGVIGNAKVVNESGGPYPKMRVRIDVQCAYDADLQEVCDLLMKIADEEEAVCQYPSPRVRVRGFADSGINVQLMGWINRPEDRGRITHILYMKVHQEFKEANLEIPYPKRDIQITSVPPAD